MKPEPFIHDFMRDLGMKPKAGAGTRKILTPEQETGKRAVGCRRGSA